jgi:DNA transformation protein
MMAVSQEYQDFVIEMLAPLEPAARRMFGGLGIFLGDAMFGLIADDRLYFKTGEGNREAYQAAGMSAFSYQARGRANRLKTLWEVPPEVLEDPDEIVVWAREAGNAALAAQLDKKAKKEKQS